MNSLVRIIGAFLFLLPGAMQAFQEVQYNASWIKECQDDRIYIKTDQIEIREDGIFVKDEYNILHPLTNILVDKYGVFTPISSISDNKLAKVWNIVWCKTCNAYRSVDVRGLCVRCGNPP